MHIVATVLVALGIIGLIYGALQKYKAGRLAKAPFVKTAEAATAGASVAGDKGAISVQGAVRPGQTLRSPVTGTECLYYELEVKGEWKDGDSTKSKSYVEEKVAAPFSLDDGSGPVHVDASEGGDFDGLTESFSETRKEGFFADLKSAVGKGEPMMFGQYAFHNPSMSKADKFTCTEKVMPLIPTLYACGRSENNAITSPSWASLILSGRSRDDLLGSTAKTAKSFLLGGAAAAASGLVMGLVSTMI